MTDEYLTLEEAALALKLSPSAVRGYVRRALLLEGEHFFRLPGGAYRFKASRLATWHDGRVAAGVAVGALVLPPRGSSPAKRSVPRRRAFPTTGHGRTCRAPALAPPHIATCLECYRRAAAGHASMPPEHVEFVYVLRSQCGLVKIGKSKSPIHRLGGIKAASPVPVDLLHLFPSVQAHDIEQALHRRFAKQRHHGEWFALDTADLDWLTSITLASGRHFFREGILCSVCGPGIPHFHHPREAREIVMELGG